MADEQDKLTALQTELAGFKESFHKLQVGWDAEIQAHVDTKTAHEATLKAKDAEHAKWTAELRENNAQAIAEHKAAIEALKAQMEKDAAANLATVATLTADHQATVGNLKNAHEATVKQLKTEHATALLREKHRVDRLEIEAKHAAELAAIQGQG